MPKFAGHISCHTEYDHEARKYVLNDPSQVRAVDFHVFFESPEAAHAYVAGLPKMLRLKTWPKSKCVAFRVNFSENGVKGALNETGIKRVKRFLDLCEVDKEAIDSANIINRSTLEDLRRYIDA